MPDFVIRHIDNLMAQRIKAMAKERQWSINDVVLHALRHGLGMASGHLFAENLFDHEDLAALGGQWDAAEQAVFQEAMQALASARAEQLAPAGAEGALSE
jgi:hypothetical protein